jgi:predicted Zn-dependent protease
MAQSAFVARRYDEAAAMFSVVSEGAPDNPWNQYMLGLSLWKSGEREGAERAFTAVLDLDPKHVKSELNLARVLLELDRPVEALTHVEKGLAIDSTSSEAWRLLGRVNGALRQREPALEAYRKAIVLDELDVWAMNNMGLLLIESGRFKEALGPLARATEIRPEAPVFQNNLGMALERTGHYTAAAIAYRAALTSDSTYRRATVSLARVEGLTEEPTLTAVDLPAIAANFAIDMRNRAQPTVVVVEPPPPGAR